MEIENLEVVPKKPTIDQLVVVFEGLRREQRLKVLVALGGPIDPGFDEQVNILRRNGNIDRILGVIASTLAEDLITGYSTRMLKIITRFNKLTMENRRAFQTSFGIEPIRISVVETLWARIQCALCSYSIIEERLSAFE